MKRLAIAILLIFLFLPLIAYERLVGFGHGHEPISTSQAIWRLFTSADSATTLETDRYLVKKNQVSLFLQQQGLTERVDSQMGAMHYFNHIEGTKCAIVIRLNPYHLLYHFQSKC